MLLSKKRYFLKPEFKSINNRVSVKYEAKDIFVRISTKDGYVITRNGEIDMKKISLKPHFKPTLKKDLQRIRKFHWRDILYNYETAKAKKVFKRIKDKK